MSSPFLSPFYLSTFVWNFAHGMANLLVPLYALHLGMSGLAIGSLVALPVVLQLVFTLLIGIYVDRLGAKNVLYLSCLCSLLTSVIYAMSSSFAGLFVGQCLFVMARASFWPANFSLGSELPGDRSRNLGRLNSVTHAGQILGTALAGMVISLAGHVEAFAATGATALTALALTAFIPNVRKPSRGRPPSILATYRDLARQHYLYFGMACAFLSVLPFTVSAAFHPVLLVSEGFTSDQIGWLLSVRAIGAIFAGIALAKWVRSAASNVVPVGSCTAMGVVLAASAVLPAAWAMLVWLLILGVASGLVGLYFQVLISENSPAEQRGSAIAFGGLGWNFSNIVAPLLMGGFTDWLDVYYAFYLIGALLLAYAVALLPLYRWAFPMGPPRASR